MQVSVYSRTGEVTKKIEISDKVFGVPFNEAVVHQVMVGQMANARQGTADTKTRSEVDGSSKKLFRQKGTGNARMGSSRSPSRRKGGIVFGPHPRDYRQDTPKKMRQLALRCVLSAKARDGELKVIEELKFDAPKTKEMVGVLEALGGASSILLVNENTTANIVKSARNIPGVKTMPANLINVVDLLACKSLLMTEAAVRQAEALWTPKEVSNASV
jgi:large subunit ribosomal protein L4